MDYSLPGSCVHGTFQARILEWVAINYSGDLLDLGTEPVSLAFPASAGRFFTTMPPGKNTEGEASNSQDKNYTFPWRVHFKA